MITVTRIGALNELEDPIGWVTALSAPARKKPATRDGPL